ncbi:hypothetical protein [Nocardioides sp.]|uniref:hypothetical protein n=1 Tax=Nocardioides sp. TaxID=35761 RepID=UPI002603A4AB|nr:hypothetical protein [Nocardioides sp.]MCW2735641.1 hypothetical protein [Nocardioides sp.]
MRTRTALAAAAVLLAAAGSMTPALAGPTGGATKGSWTFTATPNPTGDTPSQAGGTGKCAPAGGVGRATQEFTVPGPGTLDVALNNKADWSGDIRTKSDGEVLSDSDGSGPTDAEAMSANFKKKTVVIVGACNLEGEPSVTATYVFTPKKK